MWGHDGWTSPEKIWGRFNTIALNIAAHHRIVSSSSINDVHCTVPLKTCVEQNDIVVSSNGQSLTQITT